MSFPKNFDPIKKFLYSVTHLSNSDCHLNLILFLLTGNSARGILIDNRAATDIADADRPRVVRGDKVPDQEPPTTDLENPACRVISTGGEHRSEQRHSFDQQ